MIGFKQWAARWRKATRAGHDRPARSGATIEGLEGRRLLAAQLGFYYAPASVAGGTLTATVTAGTAPLQTAGSYTITPSALAAAVVGATGTPRADVYSYARLSRSVATLRFTDAATGLTFTDQLTFGKGGDTNGTFAVTATAAGSSAGSQTGTFSFAPAAAALGADEIATILPSTKKVVKGNTAGVAVANIANTGSQRGVGFVGATFYLSPDGMLADATRIGSNGRFLQLRPQMSFNTVVHFSYPNLPSGAYYLMAELTPSAQFLDVDRGNDLASSIAPIIVDQSSYSLSVPAVSVTNFRPGGTLVAGAKQTGTVAIQNTADTLAAGLVRLDLSAVAVNGTIVPVSPLGIPINLDLPAHQRLVLPVTFTVPAISGGISGFVGSIDTSGLSSVAQPFVALQTAVVSATPFGKQPLNSVAGALNGARLAQVVLNVTNTGNVDLFGRVSVNIEIATDASGSNPTLLISVEKNLELGAGASSQFPIDFPVPKDVTSGAYYLLAQAGPSATTLSVPTYKTRLIVPESDVAVSAEPLLIEQPPVPTLVATVLPLASSTVVADQDQSVTVQLTNTGNGPAKGTYLIQIAASAIGNANAVGRIPLDVSTQEVLNLPVGASQTVTVTARFPSSLRRFSSQFYLGANIDAAAIHGVTTIHVLAVSPQLLTLTP